MHNYTRTGIAGRMYVPTFTEASARFSDLNSQEEMIDSIKNAVATWGLIWSTFEYGGLWRTGWAGEIGDFLKRC